MTQSTYDKTVSRILNSQHMAELEKHRPGITADWIDKLRKKVTHGKEVSQNQRDGSGDIRQAPSN